MPPSNSRQPERLPHEWLDFSGGMNEEPPTKLGPNEVSDLVNWYPFGKVLRRRNGVQYITLGACGQPLTSVLTYVKTDPEKATNQLDFDEATFVCGAPSSVWRYDPISRWRQLESAALSESYEPWHMRQYNNAIYMCRRGAGLRVTRPPFETLYAAGIPQPATANFVASQQNDGSLFSGYYEYVLTFRNSITKAESGRGDAVRIQLTADSKWIRLANLTQPPAGSQANEIRIWRSLRVDSTPTDDPFDEYYYVGTVPVGTTVYEDKKQQDELGALLGNRTEVPPGNVMLFDIWEERAWLSDGNYVIWSEVGAPEQYYFQNRVLVGPDDGSTVTALVAWGNRLIVAKTEGIYYMLHTGPNEFSREVLSDRHGCWAGHSMRSAEGILIWFGGDAFYRSDGQKPYSITTTKLQRTLARIPFDKRHEVYAAVYPRNSWYVVSIPVENGARECLGYNYKTNAWFRLTHFSGMSNDLHWIREVPGGNLDDGLVCVTRDGHIYQYDKGNVDRPGAEGLGPWTDVPITVSVTLPIVPQGRNDGRQLLRRVRILCDTVPGSMFFQLTRDSVATKVREVFVDSSRRLRGMVRRWKLYGLASEMLGAENQLSMWRSDRDAITLEGVQVEVTERPNYVQRSA